MTCILGYAQDGKVYVGGDSAGVSGWNMTVQKQPKVFVRGDIAMGYTSSFRMGQLLQYKLVIPEHSESKSDIEYLCTDFIDAVIACFKDHGFNSTNKEQIEGGQFIVGYRGTVYFVDSEYQVLEAADPFQGCGCGASIAEGAIAALPNGDPIEKVRKALEITERLNAGVRGPFTIVEV